MLSTLDLSAYIAAGCFLLFTGVGTAAQVRKLSLRTRSWRAGELPRSRVCDGLLPLREMYSYSAFLLFALSGLTRSSIDFAILLPRLPVVALATVILWFLRFHGAPSARRFFNIALIGDGILVGMLIAASVGLELNHAVLRMAVDSALAAVCFLVFYSKQLQAFTMYKERRSHAVSWLREIGFIMKDASGLWYTATAGSQLALLTLTHVLSLLASGSICAVKFLTERLDMVSRSHRAPPITEAG